MKLNGVVRYRESMQKIMSLKAIAESEGVSVAEVVRVLVEWGLVIYRRGKRKIKISD